MTAFGPLRRFSPWIMALLCLTLVACDPNANAPAMDPQLSDGGGDAGPSPIDGGDANADAGERPLEPVLTLNSIIPNRVPITGGVQILLVGQLFEDGLRVVLGDLDCGDIQLESDSHLRCTVPASPNAGTVDVHLFGADGVEDTTLAEGLTYFVPTTVTAIEPIRGPATGGYTATIRGAGFTTGTTVRFGDRPATVIDIAEDGESVRVRVPAHPPGQAAVVVTSLNGQVEAPIPFTWYEQLLVTGLEPFVGDVAGGEEVLITGSGLAEASVVRLGGEEATVMASEFDATVLRIETPPAATPGPATLEI